MRRKTVKTKVRKTKPQAKPKRGRPTNPCCVKCGKKGKTYEVKAWEGEGHRREKFCCHRCYDYYKGTLLGDVPKNPPPPPEPPPSPPPPRPKLPRHEVKGWPDKPKGKGWKPTGFYHHERWFVLVGEKWYGPYHTMRVNWDDSESDSVGIIVIEWGERDTNTLSSTDARVNLNFVNQKVPAEYHVPCGQMTMAGPYLWSK